jgi:hypothetical protein
MQIASRNFPGTFDEEPEMKSFKSAAIILAASAGLTLSAAVFASPNSDYNAAAATAHSAYKDKMANCKSMSGDDRKGCKKDAKATQKAALADASRARKMARRDSKTSVEEQKEGPPGH